MTRQSDVYFRSLQQEPCVNDSYILNEILVGRKYNRHKIPGSPVHVTVEVWIQEITTISDITSDFQVRTPTVCHFFKIWS